MARSVRSGNQYEIAVWRAISAVMIGVVAIAAVLWITFAIDPQNQFQQNVAWAVLALGISGTTAILPGFINVTIPKVVTAGGSVAIFVLVYTQSPAGKAVVDKIIPPPGDPKAIAEGYLTLLDGEDYAKAYADSSSWLREHYPSDLYFQLLRSQRKPHGAPANRELLGANALDGPSGYPPGAYRVFAYKTVFANAPDKTWNEAVAVGSEQRMWKVFNYQIAPAP